MYIDCKFSGQLEFVAWVTLYVNNWLIKKLLSELMKHLKKCNVFKSIFDVKNFKNCSLKKKI